MGINKNIIIFYDPLNDFLGVVFYRIIKPAVLACGQLWGHGVSTGSVYMHSVSEALSIDINGLDKWLILSLAYRLYIPGKFALARVTLPPLTFCITAFQCQNGHLLILFYS